MTGRTPAARGALALILIVLALTGLALSIWQVERRTWKHSLIEAVETRSRAAPAAAPDPLEWPNVSSKSDAYRRVTLVGQFAHDRETLVQAVTDAGGGYWVMTPLVTDEFTVLVNRGFVPPDRRDPASRKAGNPSGTVRITGLLRISEPSGGFLRTNDPARNRWYSRDVAVIGAARGLGRTAPYFIDADGTPNPGGYPLGGLTVLRFSDNHLVYAITWLLLAAGCAWGAFMVWRRG